MTDDLPVRIVDRRVVTAPGTGPVAMVWLPLHGQVIAKIPPRKGNRRWLHETVGIRSPEFTGDRWNLPRSSLVRLVTASVDRYGFIVLYRDMSKLSQCTRACLEAMGAECHCSCLGAHHGQDSAGWFERIGDAVVADQGECTRTAVVYGARGSDAKAVVYDGKLAGERYRVDRTGRRDWPFAAQFMCASCMTARAAVWDHCHTHGFVRAPLCNRCNTRYWRGWRPRHGRATHSRNFDDSYYRWCPEHASVRRPCSA
ncbi:endonuclease domain-containing protein [Streptomyces netropsis]